MKEEHEIAVTGRDKLNEHRWQESITSDDVLGMLVVVL